MLLLGRSGSPPAGSGSVRAAALLGGAAAARPWLWSVPSTGSCGPFPGKGRPHGSRWSWLSGIPLRRLVPLGRSLGCGAGAVAALAAVLLLAQLLAAKEKNASRQEAQPGPGQRGSGGTGWALSSGRYWPPAFNVTVREVTRADSGLLRFCRVSYTKLEELYPREMAPESVRVRVCRFVRR